MTEYKQYLDFALDLAKQASEMIKEGSEKRYSAPAELNEKKNSVDLVTETDQAVEELIKKAIAKAYPAHKFIGEESHAAGERQELTDEFTWIVDPIDGTTNFVHYNPFVACSIGLCHKRKPVVGVIALPFLNQVFSAQLGGGAFLNSTIPLPLTGGKPQPLSSLAGCMISSEWGSDRSAETCIPKSKSFLKLMGDPSKGIEGGQMIRAFRMTGSSCCTMVMIAAGQYDLYWDAGPWAWDVCAGSIIIQEAGGFFSGGKEAFMDNVPVGDIIIGRRYVAVRPVAPTDTETAEQSQRRIIKELYEVVEPWTNSDMP